MFEMKPEYYIGIDMIDQEHKQLFDYASEAYELLQEEFTPDKYDKIDAILEKLRDYTVKHFTDEAQVDFGKATFIEKGKKYKEVT